MKLRRLTKLRIAIDRSAAIVNIANGTLTRGLVSTISAIERSECDIGELSPQKRWKRQTICYYYCIHINHQTDFQKLAQRKPA